MRAEAPEPMPDTLPPAPAIADSFALYEAQSEATSPRPRRPRSISLGYIGDAPLAGGVTRDTVIAPPRNEGPGVTWQRYIGAPSWSW